MPTVFIEAVAYVIGAGTAATVIGTALFYAAVLATTAAYANAQKRRAERDARDAANANLEDRLVMTAISGGQRSRVYGRVRNVEGVLFKATRGDDSEFYTLVVSLAGHEVDAIETIYFGDVAIELDADGWVLTAPWNKATTTSDSVTVAFPVSGAHSIVVPHMPIGGTITVTLRSGGSVDTLAYTNLAFTVSGGTTINFTTIDGGDVTVLYQWTKTEPKARVRKFLGGPDQDLSPILLPLFPALLTADDRFAGDACLIVDLEYDRDAFPTGTPNVTATIRAAKVYDQRKDSTAGGTGTQRLANPATWQWSENPAVVGNDWAHYEFGGNFPNGTVRASDVIDSANACDVSHTFSTPAGDIVRPMYTCGIVCRTDRDPSQSFGDIVDSMAGKWGWSGGELRLRAGSYRAPVREITEDWITDKSAITIVPEPPAAQAINIVRPTISDAAQSYAKAPSPDVRAEAYITEDGTELPTDVTYIGITDTDHAQHVSGVKLREERSGLTATIPCNYRALELEFLDPVQIRLPYFGWDDKVFEIAQYEFSAQGGTVLTVRETGPSIFDPDAEFTANDATPNTDLPDPFNVPTPSVPVLESGTNWLLRQSDGTLVSRLHVAWTAITDAAVVNGGAIEVRYGPAELPESQWTSFEVPGGDSEVAISGVLDRRFYVVKLRARNALVRGDWSLQAVEQILGKSAPPANVSGLNASIIQSGVLIAWTQNAELDYDNTELRLGSTWASATRLFKGAANTYTWLSPSVGTYTVLAKHFDTTGHESATATGVSVTVDASMAVQWANLAGRPKLFRVVSVGGSDISSPHASGLFNGETDAPLFTAGVGRSYNLARIRRSDGVVTFTRNYDVYGVGASGGFDAADLATDLNATTSASIVALFTYDEPLAHRFDSGLDAAMYRCGASRAIFGSPLLKQRGAYVLIGIAGCGEGQGVQSRSGAVDNDTNAWCDVTFTVQAEQLTVTGTSGTQFATDIGTDQLAHDAAAEVYVTTPTSSVAVTALAHTPDGYAFNTQVISKSFTPSDDGKAMVTVDARGNYTTTGASIGNGSWSIQDDAEPYNGWNRQDSYVIPVSSTTSFPISTTRTFDVLGGVTYTMSFYAHKLDFSDTFSIDNHQMRIVVQKR